MTHYSIEECIHLLKHDNIYDQYLYEIPIPPQWIKFYDYRINGICPAHASGFESVYSLSWGAQGSNTILTLRLIVENRVQLPVDALDEFLKKRIDASPLP